MAGKDIIIMNRKELKRLEIVKKVLKEGLKQVSAGEILELSPRQMNRIVQRVRKEGEKGVIHRLRGRESNRQIRKEIKEKIINIYQKRYKGFGPTLASEKLLEIEKLKVSDEALRKWLLETGEWQKIRGNRKHRHWRERKGVLGEMVQMDGSHHNWLENRGPWLVLMGYIDDATGRAFARFYPYEGTMPAMDSFRRYIKQNGIMQSIYLDKHTTYKSWAKPTIEDELNGVQPLSHFERALKELNVKIIHANSPQAKGRVERLFNTLQDRLVKEMRLRGVKTLKGANKFLKVYLPVYNKRFTVEAREKGNVHWKTPREINLDRILCAKAEHPVRNDFTVVHDKKLYQIMSLTNAKKVTVEERISGALRIYDKDVQLKYKQIYTLPKKQIKPTMKKLPVAIPKKKYVTPKDHPWRKSNLFYMRGY